MRTVLLSLVFVTMLVAGAAFAQSEQQAAKKPDYPFTEEQLQSIRGVDAEIAARQNRVNEARANLRAAEAELREAQAVKASVLLSAAAKFKRDPADLELSADGSGFNEKPKPPANPKKNN